MVELASSPILPVNLSDERVNNGELVLADLGAELEVAILAIAGGERKLPTVQLGELNDFEDVLTATSRDYYFATKPYLRDLHIEMLLDSDTVGSEMAVTVGVTIGGVTTTSTINFFSLAAEVTEQIPWISMLLGNVGADPGKAANGGLTATLNVSNDSSDVLYMWALDVTQLHTPVLEQ